MKLITFTHNGKTRIGALSGKKGETVVDLSVAVPSLPQNLKSFLAGGASALAKAQAAAEIHRLAQRSSWRMLNCRRRSPIRARSSASA